MKTTNFALQRRTCFRFIVATISIELLIFIFWMYNIWDIENMFKHPDYGVAICVFLFGSVVNWIGLYFLDRFVYNKKSILHKVGIKQTQLTTEREKIQNKLDAITDKNGKAIHTEAAIEVWSTIPMYCIRKFDEIIFSMQQRVHKIDDQLILLGKKEEFWKDAVRINLWMYAKSKIID